MTTTTHTAHVKNQRTLRKFLKVQMECNISQKAQSGIDWHVPAQFSEAENRPGLVPGWFGPLKDPFDSLLLLLLLLPEALKQDSFVGGVVNSRLLQVFLCDVTRKSGKPMMKKCLNRARQQMLSAVCSISQMHAFILMYTNI